MVSKEDIRNFVNNQSLIGDLEQKVVGRNYSKFDILQLKNYLNERNSDKSHNIHKLIKNEHDIILEEKDAELLSSHIYRLFASKNSKHSELFSKLIENLISFGIIFDEPNTSKHYMILLSNFVDELIFNMYTEGNHESAKEIMKHYLEIAHPNICFNYDHTQWKKFMKLIDFLNNSYTKLMNTPMLEDTELIIPTHLKEFDVENIEELKLMQTWSEISDDDPMDVKQSDNRTDNSIDNNNNNNHVENIATDDQLQVINKQEKTLLQVFQLEYGNKIQMNNNNYYNNVFDLFNVLLDKNRSNDEVFQDIQYLVNNNLQAAVFLMENRNELVDELSYLADKDKLNKHTVKEAKYASVAKNLTVTLKNKNTKHKASSVNKYDLLKALGINDNDILNKIAEETKKNVMDNLRR